MIFSSQVVAKLRKNVQQEIPKSLRSNLLVGKKISAPTTYKSISVKTLKPQLRKLFLQFYLHSIFVFFMLTD